MEKAIKICRVCGKEYKACRTLRSSNGFRWQEVACSPECGSIYLERIIESRKHNSNIEITQADIDDIVDDNMNEEEDAKYYDDIEKYIDDTE